MAKTMTVVDGVAMATRAVLAGAYRGRAFERAAVTHAVFVDAEAERVAPIAMPVRGTEAF